VVGVSADKPDTQQKFIDKFSLTFPMLSDASHDIIDAYGAQRVLGLAAERKSFLIAPDGKIAHVWQKVKVPGHVDDVVATLKSLK
jgi:peroxiredoxin Q/BCP